MYITDIKNISYDKLYFANIQFMVVSERKYTMPYAYCCMVFDLYADWMGECNLVPENDAMLLSATLYIDGYAYPIVGVGLDENIMFETLMMEIDRVLTIQN